MGELKHDLARDRELVETHISWVFLGPTDVLKVKKPVAMGFLDFSTLAARHAACESELQLNRRLSHDVYRRVAPITRNPQGHHRVDGTGDVVDYAVVMRRLPDEHRADKLLSHGRLRRADVQRIARRLASFHEQAARSKVIDTYGDPALIEGNVQENFDQAGALSTRYVSAEQEAEIEAAQLGFLREQPERFRRRVTDGKIRDGHGDLRLEHVYISDSTLEVIDCIEFNERFRFADVCADLAFLAMDLRHNAHPDLAEDLLACYAQQSSDYDLYGLVDFYEAYRAYVRAKIASFVASDETIGAAAREPAARSARGYYLHALAAQRRPSRPPILVAVGGLIASGKSLTSDRISAQLNCPVVDTDRTRKHLLGVPFDQPVREQPFGGAYSPQFSDQVYDEVLRRAEVVLESGRSVVVDASFGSVARRARVRSLARRLGLPFRFVHCSVPKTEALRRLAERERRGSVSDGRSEIYEEFERQFSPPDELPAEEQLRVDTTWDDATIDDLLQRFFGS